MESCGFYSLFKQKACGFNVEITMSLFKGKLIFVRWETDGVTLQSHKRYHGFWEYWTFLFKDAKCWRRFLSQKWKSYCVQPFLTQKEIFLVAIFFFFLEKHFFLSAYSLRRQLAIMTGFCKWKFIPKEIFMNIFAYFHIISIYNSTLKS